MTLKSAIPDRIESARKILNATASKIPELEAAEAVLSHVLAETDAEIEGMAGRRKAILASDASAAEVDKQLERHDETVRTLTRRNEVAAAISTKLATRIAADREAGHATKQRAAYDEAREIRDATWPRVKEFLDRIGAEARDVMRAYAESEMKSAAANKDLPLGAAPIHSIESERRGALRSPKTTVREFAAFVDGRRFIGEQNHVQAEKRKDGKWDVFLPGPTTGGGDYFVCSLSNYVEIVTETDATPWPENLAKCLSVPSFYVTDRSGWDPVDDPLPAAVTDALNRLEQPPHHFEPRVSTRVMTLTAWRELNGKGVEVEPAPVAVAAE
jgi:hypothetical protein